MLLTEARVQEILEKPELKTGLTTYSWLMERFRRVDVSEDAAFQRRFRDFYQMRRFYSDEFARGYFKLLERMKYEERSMSFSMALERIKHIRSTFEMSFASKMLHTIDPSHPIWDSVVTKQHFGIKAPSSAGDFGARERRCVQRYAEYENVFYEYMRSAEGHMLIEAFDRSYPDSGIGDVKKVDFILWQDR